MGKYLDRITARFNRQEQKGIEKYGQILEQNHGNYDYRLEHLAEELYDLANYWCNKHKDGRLMQETCEDGRRG